METFLFILEFFVGLALVFVLSWLVGKLFKLDEYYEAFQKAKTRIQKKN